jgi:hypothetical protein
MAMETLTNVFVCGLSYALICSHLTSMTKIVPTKMQSRVANGTHPFEEEEEEVQTILNCEVKFSNLGKGFKIFHINIKKNIDSKTIFPFICFLKL